MAEAHMRLCAVAESLALNSEFIFVNDGSCDGTSEILEAVSASDSRVRVIEFSRNFGHQVATTAGIEHARGDAVVLIDADLQDPPEIIVEMVGKWRNGADVVFGVRTERRGDSVLKRATAALFYRMINVLSEIPIPLDTGDFRLMDRKVVTALLQMPERDRFLRGMVSWVGFRQEPVYYRRAPRLAGTTKYPVRKMLNFAVDGVLSSSRIPLRVAVWLGLLCSGLAFLGGLVALAARLFTRNWVPGWASLFLAVLFIGGVQLVCIGMVGEYVGRIYGEVKQRPLYLVRRRIGFDQEREARSAAANQI